MPEVTAKLYPQEKRNLIIVAITIAMVTFGGIVLNYIATAKLNESNSTLGASDDQVEVTAAVSTTNIVLITHPARRTPPTNNWSTTETITLKDCVSRVTTNVFSGINSNNLGEANITVPIAANLYGSRRLEVRGLSHLNRNMGCINFNRQSVDLEFIAAEEELIPGETSVIYDNFINSLDISPLINSLNTSTTKYDLDLNGNVSLTDLSIQVDYLYVAGD